MKKKNAILNLGLFQKDARYTSSILPLSLLFFSFFLDWTILCLRVIFLVSLGVSGSLYLVDQESVAGRKD